MQTLEGQSAVEQLRDMATSFHALKTKRDNALDECGIGHDVEDRLRLGNEAIADFLGKLAQRLYGQLYYDHLTNVPCGILSRWEVSPETQVQRSIAGALGALVKWDIMEARLLAANILEDVNDHGTAKMLRELKD